MKSKSLFEKSIVLLFIAVCLLAAARLRAQTTEVFTSRGNISVVNAGVDRVMVQYGNKAAIVKVRHLEKAGDIEDQFKSILLMAEDASFPGRYLAAYKGYLQENGLPDDTDSRIYFEKAWKAKNALAKVLPPVVVAEVTHRLR